MTPAVRRRRQEIALLARAVSGCEGPVAAGVNEFHNDGVARGQAPTLAASVVGLIEDR